MDNLWSAIPGYLDTASYGLPPTSAWEQLQAALDDWRRGRTSWEHWDEWTQRARASFARLMGVAADDVAVGSTVAQALAPVAAAVPDGGEVVVVEGDFASTVFPFLTHADRGVTVRAVPAGQLATALVPGVDVVAFTLVQASTGAITDLAAVSAAARSVGAWVVVDATQAAGWLPIDASLADVVVAHAYKWLMSPRGTTLAYLSPAITDRLRPGAAGWYNSTAGYFGPPLTLPDDARRFDLSPGWHAWVGTAPALELIERIGVQAIHDHDVALANRFRQGVGLPPGDSAIVSVALAGVAERLRAAGIRASVRAGRARLSFHVYTTEADVDLALAALNN